MKIIIIGLGRSGTTSFQKGLKASINNSSSLFEVFNNQSPHYIGTQSLKNHIKKLYSFPHEKTLIEKNLIQDPLAIIGNTPSFADFTIEEFNKYVDISHIILNFYLEYSLNFDKIILMSRKNLKEATESWVNSAATSNFFQPYKPLPQLDTSKFSPLIDIYSSILETLSFKLNIPITYYEDLYTGNKKDIQVLLNKNDLQIDNFELLYEYLHPKNRLRQN
jgi:hypothetical protein